MKQFLRISSWGIRRRKAHILLVALLIYFPPIFAEPINEPSLIKDRLLSFGEILPKVINGNLEIIKKGFQNDFHLQSIIRPISGDWIQPFKNGVGFFVKGVFGINKTKLIPRPPSEVGSEAGQENSRRCVIKMICYVFDHPYFIPVILFMLIWPFVVLKNLTPK
jgi:hypothetical protein